MSEPALTARWEAVHFDRGGAFWGFVLRDDEGHVLARVIEQLGR